ncbi:ferritin-like domain-containing protein [Jiella avicenniae]|uniref:Ferritin-like domain-containing protein n=1 Tax=Jiella avicenniae TaxID=2907202 RepID=A0A9X1P3V8_9HYPH|nr:ferritin-like domain-containing protein [Jiella avicenniae]MCE7030975.1 ferritin-like domain-containing protein [Jiella avicenniae]
MTTTNEPVVQDTILNDLDPELATRLTSRRDVIAKTALQLGALATVPVLLGGCAARLVSGGMPQQVVDVLNFALTLEYLEDEFYRTALSQPRLIPASDRAVFEQISKHESAHVTLLATVLGFDAVAKPKFDFTAGGTFPDVFSNYRTFSALSQAFEDTGVRAYKGQAVYLIGASFILLTALKIHSVEARHAAEVRRLRGEDAWISGSSRGNLPAAAQPVYAGDGRAAQLGVSSFGVPREAVTEAFDEPLSKAQVLGIAGMFIASA